MTYMYRLISYSEACRPNKAEITAATITQSQVQDGKDVKESRLHLRHSDGHHRKCKSQNRNSYDGELLYENEAHNKLDKATPNEVDTLNEAELEEGATADDLYSTSLPSVIAPHEERNLYTPAASLSCCISPGTWLPYPPHSTFIPNAITMKPSSMDYVGPSNTVLIQKTPGRDLPCYIKPFTHNMEQ